eukprot:86396-Chlamydomonas_euryale.AAC.4
MLFVSTGPYHLPPPPPAANVPTCPWARREIARRANWAAVIAIGHATCEVCASRDQAKRDRKNRRAGPMHGRSHGRLVTGLGSHFAFTTCVRQRGWPSVPLQLLRSRGPQAPARISRPS